MFGADSALVFDALQIAGLAFAAGAGGLWFFKRRKRQSVPAQSLGPEGEKNDLENRVRVLERIATDRSINLSDEIEELRDGFSRMPVATHKENIR